ncbi:MAG: cryptochrome/photolyase family protein [Chthoniobacterales bacterium]
MNRTIWILGDQLSRDHPALATSDRAVDRVLFIESRKRGAHLRYHRQKLVLIYAAMRHFARELEAEGWQVDYHQLGSTDDFSQGWDRHLASGGSRHVLMAAPNNLFEQHAITAIGKALDLDVHFLPPVQFVVARDDFAAWASGRKQLRMEDHYRRMRAELGVLLDENGKPEGGSWNYDPENRRTFRDWHKDAPTEPPPPPGEKPDALTQEVIAAVDQNFPDAPGEATGFWLPVTRDAALRWLDRFVTERLSNFGNYQDLMLAGERTLFHSVLSPLINVGLLGPMECVTAAVDAYRSGRAPLAAVEGFVRQIIGWREFINGVYWLRMPEYAELNALGADRDLPEFFYTGETDLHCLHQTLTQVIDTGYNHHIQRLMILGNFLLLTGVRPSEALRWFTEMYVDAYEWVMAGNVIGMALHADGGYLGSKPYAGAAAYISKMSNYCSDCAYDPKQKSGPGACPFNLLYWSFYDQHQDRFVKNPRTAMIVRSWRKRPAAARDTIVREAHEFLSEL